MPKNSLEEALIVAVEASRAGRHDEAYVMFEALGAEYPDEALIFYERASAHDRAEDEAGALPHYRRALELGLHEEERKGALLGMGSTLRNLGQHEESVRVLSEAVSEFPNYPALRVFLALSLYSHGDTREAMRQLLEIALTTPMGLDGYEQA
ncbi:MAG: tetratricopeptide repeat protein, partial [Burkholderiales bacterium]|nr:tetratricopeptide repeat protein [Anaerolineae bacterium]